jgi:hypothetical protein
MKDDFGVSFDPNRHYAGVRMQQGEVPLDDDWNETSDGPIGRAAREVVTSFHTVVDLAARADSLVHSPELEAVPGGPADRSYSLDPDTGSIRFGDGVAGAVPGAGVSVEAGYRSGAGGAGRVAMVQPFPVDLAVSRDDADWGIQLLEAWTDIADKLTAYQEAIAGEAYLPSAGRQGDGGERVGDRDPVGGLAALLRDARGLRESLVQRLERARPDSPPSGDDD